MRRHHDQPPASCVDVLQVIPITETERALFGERGLEALEGDLEATDLTDFGRDPVA